MKFDVYEEVKEAKKIAISGHINPDGDCIGACLGMYFYLKKRLPKADIVVLLQSPDSSFRGIPGVDVISSSYEREEIFDVFLLLDTVSSRIGEAEKYFETAKKTINIDHHISNASGCGDVNFIVPTASAASELVYECILPEYMDATIAELLYMGIAHDTGVFKFSNTSPETLRIVAKLMEYGFDFSKLLDETFYEKTYLQNRIQGRIVLDSRLYFDGQVIVGSADRQLMEEFGATKNDFDGVVNQLRVTKGVICAVFLYEKNPGLFKVSMRSSSDEVNVATVATFFGGGGHMRAAGVDIPGNVKDIEEKILAEVKKQIG